MRLKFILPLTFCALALTACKTTEGTAATQAAPSNDQANKELVLSFCEADAQVCGCFADSLVKTLTPTQWVLLDAALKGAAEPPAGTTESDLGTLNEKLSTALQACSK